MFGRWVSGVLVIAGLITACRAKIPDLSETEAADIISREPKFNHYARLVKVESVFHAKGSMNFASTGKFTFVYLDPSAGTGSMLADVEFRYQKGKWYLNRFDYGCPSDCHFIYVYDGPGTPP
jgi:hypothetical protein